MILVRKESISIAHILEEKGLLSANKANMLLNSKDYDSIVRCLIENTHITEDEIIQIITEYYNIPYANLDSVSVDMDLSVHIPYSYAKNHNVIPFHEEGGTLYVAMEDPLNIHAIEDIKSISNMDIKPFICYGAQIERMITLLYSELNVRNVISDYKKELNTLSMDYGIEEISPSNYNIKSSPVVRFFDTVLAHAVADNASDIHIEPFEDDCRIRFRTDGELHTVMTIPKDLYTALIGRIKVLGKLDIAETRQPQDGRLMTTIEREDIDIRISTIPTLYGEKVVLRLLNKSRYFLTKERLGLNKKQMQSLNILLNNPNGIILVTGPAGSGKTTTLYAVLHELNHENRNIITIEDPIEYTIHGINQIQVNSKIGFANGLRATLRQDPDIIMVGEIRDRETADMAIRSAITGHLVLSTLHTNDAVGAVIRLIDMGVEQFLLASSMIGVISQRLIRVLCPMCKEKSSITPQEMHILDAIDINGIVKELYSPVGCSFCNFMGYRGRTGIFEIFIITDDVKYALSENITEQDITELAIHSGMEPMKDQCLALLANGTTDIREVLKIVYSNDLMRVSGGGGHISI